MTKSNQRQIGGNHYLKYKFQPVELFAITKWDYVQSSVAKYILRYENKGGVVDLDKAKHCCELGMDLFGTYHVNPNFAIIDVFCRTNDLTDEQARILHLIDSGRWSELRPTIQFLMAKYNTNQ